MFRALSYPSYRLFFIGQFLPYVGMWMHNTARSWLVYRLTHDAFYLGLVALLGQIPIFILGFHAGFAIDRYRHLRIVSAAAVLASLQAGVLAALTFTGRIEIEHVLVLTVALGIVHAFDIPTRQVIIGELVEPADRSNAIAVNAILFNICRTIGPFAAGLLIVRYGEGICFAANAVFQIVFLVTIVLMGRARQVPSSASGPVWSEIGSGIAYALKTPPIRRLLGIITIFSIAALPLFVLLPILAAEILGGGAKTLGLITAMSGVGATFGGLAMARRSGTAGMHRLILGAVVLFAMALGGLALSHTVWVSSVLMWFVGFAVISMVASVNSLLQEISSDRYRGRVVGFFIMLFIGVNPIGSFLVGVLASRVGVTRTLFVQALILFGLAIWNGPSLRRIIEKRL